MNQPRTLDVVADTVESVLEGKLPGDPEMSTLTYEIATAVLDLLTIAHDTDEACTVVRGYNGSFGLTEGNRIRFHTGPDPHDVIDAHLEDTGQVEIRTEGLGYSMILRPSSSNVATVEVSHDR